MQYLKRNTKYSILVFLVIVLSVTTSISTLAKTEVYFFLYDNPQILLTSFPKPEVKNININILYRDELVKISQISQLFTQKIINLRESQYGNPKSQKTSSNCWNWAILISMNEKNKRMEKRIVILLIKNISK